MELPHRRDSISVRELYSLCRPNDLRPKIEESRNGGSSRILYAVGRVESAISTGSREALDCASSSSYVQEDLEGAYGSKCL